MKTATYRVICLSRAVSPITHMAGNEGNESVLMRESVRFNGSIRWVPVLSGNALRHRLVRAPAAMHMVEVMQLGGKLTLEQLNFLFHGGNLTGGAAGRVNARFIADMYRLFPVLRLLGGSLPHQIVPGSLIAERGTLVCRENRERLKSLLSESLSLSSGVLPSAASCVEGYQYTRRDISDSQPQLAGASSETQNANGSQMIFSGQSVVAGSLFLHGFIAQNVLPIELGALLHSIQRWQADGATIGGQGARGHGRLHLMARIEPEVNQQELVEVYTEHVSQHANDAREFLYTVFSPPQIKIKKGRGKQLVNETEACDAAG